VQAAGVLFGGDHLPPQEPERVVDCLPPWQREEGMVQEGKLEVEVEVEVKFADEKFLPGQHVRENRACQDFEQNVGLRKDHWLDGVLHHLKW
jgi:hypothetical protein